MNKLLSVLIISSIFAGCGRKSLTKPDNLTKQALLEVQKAASEILGKSPCEIQPDSTFSALGADDLDVVEITLELEDKLDILISDDQLAKAAGVSQSDNLAQQLTPRVFAQVVASSPQIPKPKTQDSVDNGNLREAQVGVYSKLCNIPNPHGYELVFIPSLHLLKENTEQRLGRELTPNEYAELKNKAAVIAMPKAMAEEMRKKQSQR